MDIRLCLNNAPWSFIVMSCSVMMSGSYFIVAVIFQVF